MKIVDQTKIFICPKVASCHRVCGYQAPYRSSFSDMTTWSAFIESGRPCLYLCPKQAMPLDSMVIVYEERPA
jgi:MinD superfamily P-loop ATPase